MIRLPKTRTPSLLGRRRRLHRFQLLTDKGARLLGGKETRSTRILGRQELLELRRYSDVDERLGKHLDSFRRRTAPDNDGPELRQRDIVAEFLRARQVRENLRTLVAEHHDGPHLAALDELRDVAG